MAAAAAAAAGQVADPPPSPYNVIAAAHTHADGSHEEHPMPMIRMIPARHTKASTPGTACTVAAPCRSPGHEPCPPTARRCCWHHGLTKQHCSAANTPCGAASTTLQPC